MTESLYVILFTGLFNTVILWLIMIWYIVVCRNKTVEENKEAR